MTGSGRSDSLYAHPRLGQSAAAGTSAEPSNKSGHSPPLPKLLRYLCSAGAISAFNLICMFTLVEMAGLRPRPAAIITACFVILVSFSLMRSFVFRHAREKSMRRQLKFFIAGTLGFRACEFAAFSVAMVAWPWDYRFLYVTVLLVSAMTKYLVYSRLVFA